MIDDRARESNNVKERVPLQGASEYLHLSTAVYQANAVRVDQRREQIVLARIRIALSSYQFPIAIL